MFAGFFGGNFNILGFWDYLHFSLFGVTGVVFLNDQYSRIRAAKAARMRDEALGALAACTDLLTTQQNALITRGQNPSGTKLGIMSVFSRVTQGLGEPNTPRSVNGALRR